jgi:large subunit ribosomal protein L21
MYAVIKTGGKQYRVEEGNVLKIEKLELDEGTSVDFSEVLMVQKDGEIHCGKPFIKGAKVSAIVEEQGRHKKIKIIKFRRRKHYDRQYGHRQYFTAVRITAINMA